MEALIQAASPPATKPTDSFASISTPSWDAQRAIEKDTNKDAANTADFNNTKQEQKSSTNLEQTEHENPFENSLENADREANDNDTIVTNKPLGPEEQARLHSLKSMLDASNARYAQANRKRGPVFAAGLNVRVTQGTHMGIVGTIVDADYIEDRALLTLPDQDTPKWIDFKSLGHAD